jgi:hypothetical protein
VAYNQIKHIIKIRTSNDQVRPLSIPGQGADVRERRDLEDELFTRLQEEHDHANLFVKTKCGEIQQRLSMFIASLKSLEFSLLTMLVQMAMRNELSALPVNCKPPGDP